MAKVNAGPIVSDVRGSVGPVTYYTQRGQLIARARIAPNQFSTPARDQARNDLRLAMKDWFFHKLINKVAWDFQAADRMFGMNLFVQQNVPRPGHLGFLWPDDNGLWPNPSLCWFDKPTCGIRVDEPFPGAWSGMQGLVVHVEDPGQPHGQIETFRIAALPQDGGLSPCVGVRYFWALTPDFDFPVNKNLVQIHTNTPSEIPNC